MASLFGITVVYDFTYRGDSSEEWSSVYHFKDPPPTNDTEWEAQFMALGDIVRAIIPSSCAVVRMYGYDSDADNAHAVADFLPNPTGGGLAGTFMPGTGDRPFSGDQAALVSWRTDRKNSRGKWIYLRKYLHAGFIDATDPDLLAADYKAVLVTYAAHFDGSSDNFGNGLRSKSHADTVTVKGPSDYVTTRTLRRRGKRPLAGG